ncbi:MAG: UDP-N-acetylglucosamine 1-carboxyvinyltransferase [Clostridia bacterium]|nr:UDP-N-acetylglucosamine 1-carboxyvinyltransferase [Clostridia bacterium]
MEKYRIRGGNPLVGTVDISGAKNAVLPILAAVVLTEEVCCIENIPNLADVSTSLDILSALGANVRRLDSHTVEIDPSHLITHVVPHDLSQHMRASYYYLGSLLGRFGVARTAMPGGCNFGVRPIDLHLKGFRALGAEVPDVLDNGMIEVKADRLTGNSVYLDQVSVGATVNIMLAAVKARGLTVIENAAKEPHIVDLANFLNSMGADVRGAGTDVIKIRGVDYLRGASYSIIPDQIEAGTYMAAAVATGGNVLVRGVIPKHLESITAKLEEMGADIEELEDEDSIRVSCHKPLHRCTVKTMPHPGFPTDMQPQIAVLLSIAQGTSFLTENIWDNRFKYLGELRRMGADVQVNGNTAVFQGVPSLSGAPVRANDLRAGAAMVIAALCANGESIIDDICYIERGYEEIVEKLQALGADIERVYVSVNTMPQAQ